MKDIENIKCTLCGGQLEVVEAYDGPKDSYYEFFCHNCGTSITCRDASADEREFYKFYEDGEPIDKRRQGPDLDNSFCINCGHRSEVHGNSMRSDYEQDLDPDDDAMTFEMGPCPYCGCMETRYDVSNNDVKKYPYWKEQK